MKRKSPLRRATPLKRSRKRLKIRVRKRDLEWARAVKERDAYICQRFKIHANPRVTEPAITGPCPGNFRANARGVHACHIFGRSKKTTRWDLDNGLTLCMGCHLYFHAHPLEFVEFAKRELGEARFDALRRRAMGLDKTQITMTEEDDRGAHVS